MDSLPEEIITEILDYLSFEDRRQMALVNTLWNRASMHPVLLRKELFFYDEGTNIPPDTDEIVRTDSLKYNDFMVTLLKSKRELLNIKFNFKSLITHLEDVTIFSNLGVHIKCICLEDVKWFSDTFLDAITINCKSLESLTLRCIHCLSITEKNRAPLLSLNDLTLDIVPLTDMDFNIFTGCFPNLKDIGIFGCKMLVWPQAIKQFYPYYRDVENLTNYNSRNVFTDINFIHYLKTANYLKNLKLPEYPHILLHLPEDLKLQYITLDSISANGLLHDPSGDMDEYISALSKQTLLQRLDIICCTCCSLLSVIPKLVNLKELTVHFSTMYHPNCRINNVVVVKSFLNSLSCNKNIKVLAIRNAAGKFQGANMKTLFEIPDCVLKSLTTLICPLGDSLKLLNVCKNLTYLEIPNGDLLTANDLKLLFKNLTNLRKLFIDDCLTLNDDVLIESPISNLKGLVDLDITSGNLTYKCFPFIKLMDLSTLRICGISVGQCIEKKDMSDFENSLKEFASYVPALTALEFEFTAEDRLKALRLNFDLLQYASKRNEFIPYFKILKYIMF